MKIKELIEFKFIYYPWDKNFPVKRLELIIYAEDRKTAELINLNTSWKFFDQDCHVKVEEIGVLYQEVIE